MAYYSGDTRAITINHPTLGSATIQAKAGEVFTYDIGGIRKSDIFVTGQGTGMYKMNNVPWEVSGPIAWDMTGATNGINEIEFLEQLSASNEEATFTFQNINGSTYQGSGSIKTDIKGDTQESTIQFTAGGGGKLTKTS